MSDTQILFDTNRTPSPAQCGCVLYLPTAVLLCPLHASAADLLAACEDLISSLVDAGRDHVKSVELARAAIRKAKPEGK